MLNVINEQCVIEYEHFCAGSLANLGAIESTRMHPAIGRLRQQAAAYSGQLAVNCSPGGNRCYPRAMKTRPEHATGLPVPSEIDAKPT